MIELEKEQMNALRALADTNMKISEAKGTLQKLRESENLYLEERDKKALERIDNIFSESEEIIKKAKGNYEEVIGLYNTVASFSQFLNEMYEKFTVIIEDFNERDREWNEKIKKREKLLEDLKEKIRIDGMKIKSDREMLKVKEENLRKESIKVEDKKGIIERAIKRLKENRI